MATLLYCQVGKQNNESFLGVCDAPRAHPIDAIASGGKLPGGKSCLLKCNCLS